MSPSPLQVDIYSLVWLYKWTGFCCLRYFFWNYKIDGCYFNICSFSPTLLCCYIIKILWPKKTDIFYQLWVLKKMRGKFLKLFIRSVIWSSRLFSEFLYSWVILADLFGYSLMLLNWTFFSSSSPRFTYSKASNLLTPQKQ